MTIVLEVTVGPCGDFGEQWAAQNILRLRVPYERARDVIRGLIDPDLVVDAIVIHCRDIPVDQHPFSARSTRELVLLASDIRELPQECAMIDGRQWRAIPVVALVTPETRFEFYDTLEAAGRQIDEHPARVDFADHNDVLASIEVIKRAVEAYRRAVLSEFDDMGFVVRYEKGRYKVGPALRPKEAMQGRYYFGPADRRTQGFITLHRDNFGIQVEVETFEALINRPDVREQELQEFFESHPHFLSDAHTPLPQVRLPSKDGDLLIPDFILKPIVAQQRDSTWQVLDLKLPREKLLAGRGSRARLSASVMKAIRQLRDYHENIAYPDHADKIEELLGHRLRYPSLGVLIGRLANTDSGSLEREQQHLAGIRIVTYDEVLRRQQVQVS
jgi:hypothetical protein